MRFERGEMNAHRRGTDRRCVCSTGGQLVAAHAPAFRVMVRFQVGWRARAGCAVAWDVLRARESAVDIGVCVSRGLQTGVPLVAAHAPAFPVAVQCCSSFKLRRFKTVAPRGLSSGLHLGAARAAQTVRRIPDCVELGPGRPQHWGRPGPSEAQLGLFYPSSGQNWDKCTPTGIVPPSVGGGSGLSWGRIGPQLGPDPAPVGAGGAPVGAGGAPSAEASGACRAQIATSTGVLLSHAGAPQLGEPPQLG